MIKSGAYSINTVPSPKYLDIIAFTFRIIRQQPSVEVLGDMELLAPMWCKRNSVI